MQKKKKINENNLLYFLKEIKKDLNNLYMYYIF